MTAVRTILTIRSLLFVQIAMFGVLATIHFGLLIDGYGHRAAATTELVIVSVLVCGLLLTWASPPWNQRAAIAAQVFATLGVVVGMVTFVLGIGPRTILDLCFNVILLVMLCAGLVLAQRWSAGFGLPAWRTA